MQKKNYFRWIALIKNKTMINTWAKLNDYPRFKTKIKNVP